MTKTVPPVPLPDGLEGFGLRLRPLRDSDFEDLYAAASDPLIWAGHPSRTRYQRDVFRDYFNLILTAGGTLLVSEADTGRVIGCTRFYREVETPARMSIGFTFLVRDHWGGASNRAMKTLCLDHLFQSEEAVWFHIAPTNLRSQKATEKLGAVLVERASADAGSGPSDWMIYRLSARDWRAQPSQIS